MAHSTSQSSGSTEHSTTPATKGKGRLKTAMLAAGVLLGEAALIAGAFMYLGSPEEVTAEMAVAPPVENQRITEVQLVDEQLTNDRLGSVYVYPVEVYVHVPEDESTWIADLISQYQNEIRAEMTALWRSADPAALQDPRMEVMTRRIETLLRKRFEGDSEPEFSRINKVVIVSGTGFRVRG